MGKKLYVGNLTYNVNEADLEAFRALRDGRGTNHCGRDTNRSKGFGFVEMDTERRLRQRSKRSTITSMTDAG